MAIDLSTIRLRAALKGATMHDNQRFPVPCPRDYCGAQVGEHCRSAYGNPTATHIPRIDAAEVVGLTCASLSREEIEQIRKAEALPKWRRPRAQQPELMPGRIE